MATAQYSCPHCRSVNVIHAGNVGHRIRCLHCQGNVEWKDDTPVAVPDEPQRPRPKNRRAICEGMFAICLAAPMLWFASEDFLLACRSRSWVATEGTVLYSHVKAADADSPTPGVGTGVTFRNAKAARIQYRYRVDGTRYEDDTVRFGQIYSNSTLFGRAEATVKQFPPGPATIYYCPEDPGLSVLQPGLNIDIWIMSTVPLIFLAAGFGRAWIGWRPRH